MNRRKDTRTAACTGRLAMVAIAASISLLLLMGNSFGQGRFTPYPKTAHEAVEQLVMANRILALEGIFDYAGHVSVRNPENPKTFFVARSVAPESATMADILEVDMEGNVVTETAMKPYAERIIHARIYEARPDVNAVVHAHPPVIIAFSISTVPLRPVTHSAAQLIEPTGAPLYDGYDFTSPGATGMLVTTKEEGDRLALRLGKSSVVLMRAHGYTAVGKGLPDVVMTAIAVRNNALVQLAGLQLGGKIKYISPGEVMRGPSIGSALAAERAWDAYVARVKKAMADMR